MANRYTNIGPERLSHYKGVRKYKDYPCPGHAEGLQKEPGSTHSGHSGEIAFTCAPAADSALASDSQSEVQAVIQRLPYTLHFISLHTTSFYFSPLLSISFPATAFYFISLNTTPYHFSLSTPVCFIYLLSTVLFPTTPVNSISFPSSPHN